MAYSRQDNTYSAPEAACSTLWVDSSKQNYRVQIVSACWNRGTHESGHVQVGQTPFCFPRHDSGRYIAACHQPYKWSRCEGGADSGKDDPSYIATPRLLEVSRVCGEAHSEKILMSVKTHHGSTQWYLQCSARNAMLEEYICPWSDPKASPAFGVLHAP